MDTFIEIKLLDVQDEKILDKIFIRLEEIDKEFNRKSKESDLYLINNNKNYTPVEEVYSLIERSVEYADDTDGNFNPAIGDLVDLWGIDSSGREVENLPNESQINESLKNINYQDIVLENGNVILKNENLSIDLGAIVKGYATDEVCKILEEENVKSAIIDLGGNIFVYGEKKNGEAYRVGITNPIQKNTTLLILEGKDFSCVTSGDYQRYITYNGKKYHHILDPKVGYPVDNKINSVSIISKSSEIGDMLSTSCFIMGIEESLPLLEKYDVEAIFVSIDKVITATDGAYEMIDKDSIADGFSLEKISR